MRRRQAALRREPIDNLRELLAQSRQEFLAVETGLLHQEIHLLGRKDLGEVGGRDFLVLAGAHPRVATSPFPAF